MNVKEQLANLHKGWASTAVTSVREIQQLPPPFLLGCADPGALNS